MDIVIGDNLYTALSWEYDARLGRRWNVDPVVKPWESSYASFSNNPLMYVDPSGLDPSLPDTKSETTTAVAYQVTSQEKNSSGDIIKETVKFTETVTETRTSYSYNAEADKVEKTVEYIRFKTEVTLTRTLTQDGNSVWSEDRTTTVSEKSNTFSYTGLDGSTIEMVQKYTGMSFEEINTFVEHGERLMLPHSSILGLGAGTKLWQKASSSSSFTTLNNVINVSPDLNVSPINLYVHTYKTVIGKEAMGTNLFTIDLEIQKMLDDVMLVTGVGSALAPKSSFFGNKYLTMFSGAFSAASKLRKEGALYSYGEDHTIYLNTTRK